MDISALEEENPYMVVRFSKCLPAIAKETCDFDPKKVTSDGKAGGRFPKIKDERADIDINNAAGINNSHGQQEEPYDGLCFVAVVDAVAPLVTFGGVYLMMLFRRILEGAAGNLVKGNSTYSVIFVANLLQTIMGTMLLLKLEKKIFNEIAMSLYLLAYHVVSAGVMVLQLVVLGSQFLSGIKKDNNATNDEFSTVVIIIEAAVMIGMRLPLFITVEKVRKTPGNQA